MKEDMETLSPEEARALHLVARRGYDGDPFDVAEIDEKIGAAEIHALLNKRLIVRSGARYNVYWDIFRDFLVENKVPTLGESFLLRQFPTPCIATLDLLLRHNPATLAEILGLSPGLTEGTALNRLRELRYLGAVTKVADRYTVRPTLRSVDEFRHFMHDRLREHIVVRSLRRLSKDSISHDDVVSSLQVNFKGYGFAKKTWETYASYFIAWLRYSGIDFGRRLGDTAQRTTGSAAFVPQWRPEKDCEVFFSLRGQPDVIPRTKRLDKPLYDLKTLGLLGYEGGFVTLTKRGITVLKLEDTAAKKEIAQLALTLPKVEQAYKALKESRAGSRGSFENNLAPVLSAIRSDSYRKVAASVLKSWARFISGEIDGSSLFDGPTLFRESG
jgi:hypothetical protein